MHDVERTAQLARASGLHSTWFFMLGGPGETRATVNETLAFVERALAGPRFLSVFMTGIRMLPGTRLAAAHRAGHRPGAIDVLFSSTGQRGVDAGTHQRHYLPPVERGTCRRGR